MSQEEVVDGELVLEPWDRRNEESDEAFEAFHLYRDQGPSRSIASVAETLEKSEGLLYRWSSRHDWVDRAAGWDLEQDRIRRAALTRQNVAAAERHARQMASFLDAGDLFAKELVRRIEESPDLLEKLNFPELMENLARLARVGPRLVVAERLARGMTTESVELGGAVELHRERAARMPDSELDAFLAGAQAQRQLDPGPPVE